MNNWIREPLLHFFLLGAAIFVLFALFDPSPRPRSVNAIVVSDDDARRLIAQFEAVWRRRPSERELDHMISKFVREEVYVREALALGLDKDDAVIRRRLQMKMEFLTESGAEAAKPDDATLQAHLNANSDRFAQPSLVAFDQILLGDNIGDDDAAAIKTKLSGGEPPENYARSSLLPSQFRLSPETTVESTFGAGFFESIFAFPIAEWSGPVRSPFGSGRPPAASPAPPPSGSAPQGLPRNYTRRSWTGSASISWMSFSGVWPGGQIPATTQLLVGAD